MVTQIDPEWSLDGAITKTTNHSRRFCSISFALSIRIGPAVDSYLILMKASSSARSAAIIFRATYPRQPAAIMVAASS